MTDLDCVTWPSNSVAWANGDGLSPAKLRDLRQISANVEAVNTITIEGSSSITLLILFRPKRYQQNKEDKQKRRRSARFLPSPRSEPSNEDSWQNRTSGSSQATSSASSQASFQSSPKTTVTDGRSPLFDGSASPTPFKSNNHDARALPLEFPALHHANHRHSARGQLSIQVTPARDRDDAASSPQASGEDDEQIISVPFYATFCKPQINLTSKVDQPNRDEVSLTSESSASMIFDFGDILVGRDHSYTLAFQNLGQIDCCWQARLEDADNNLPMCPLSLRNPLDEEQAFRMVNEKRETTFSPYWLQPFTTQPIALHLNATDACRDYKQSITLTNLHDTSNNIHLLIKANILGVARDDLLSILSGDVLDFGDCCGGQWTRQIVLLRNESDGVLDINFSASKGADVTFEIAKVVPEAANFSDTTEESLLSSSSSSAASQMSAEDSKRLSSRRGPSAEIEGHTDESVRTPALDSMRTPISRAQNHPDLEPPPLTLSAESTHDETLPSISEDDLKEANDSDAYSNASQAGSQPGSPALLPSVPSATGSTLEKPSVHSLAMESIGDHPGRHSILPHVVHAARPEGSIRESDRSEDVQSVISEVTTTSHDSKRSVFAATISQAGSASAILTGSRRGPHPLSGLRNVDHTPMRRLDELQLQPGTETRILVSYRPPRGILKDDSNAGRLRAVDFFVYVDFGQARPGTSRSRGPKDRKFLTCKARTCTSFISLSPRSIDFGETNVGAKKSATLSVTNSSELTARVDVRFVSKVLSMYRDEVPIPALQTVDLKVDFFPRRINDSYRKQITVTNLLNRDNDQIFEVRAQNVDKQRVTFHSLFYRILTVTGANFIDFGDVNINSTRVRSFSIENTSLAPLALEVSAANQEDLALYVKNPKVCTSDVTTPPRTDPRAPTRYAATEIPDRPGPHATEASRQSAAKKGSGLKERFLETISMDSPTSIRNENASWRLAQKQAQTRKRAQEEITKREKESKPKAAAKTKPPVNLVSALRKGGKGKITLRYGSAMMFKDRKALSGSEYLDLAFGPPIDPQKVSVKSKLFQQLEQLASQGKVARQIPTAEQVKMAPAPRKAAASERKPIKDATLGEKADRVRAPALTGQRSTPRKLADFSDASKLSLEELIAAMESQNSSLHTFFLGDSEAEERQVRTEINLQRRLSTLLAEHQLIPAEVLRLAPNEERQVIAIYTPNGSTRPHVQGNARKQDSRIFLRLMEFDEALVTLTPELAPLLKLDRDELPVRDLMIKSTTCRSIMELGQPHINFGHMDKGESKTRRIVIQNRSEWALRYCIRKSGSIASGDISIATGRFGIIPGYAKREVEFVFSPSMSGAFQEKLVVENVADRDNDQRLILKANIRKVPNFSVEPSVLMMGRCRPHALSDACCFTVANISAKARTFVVDVDRAELQKHSTIIDVVIFSGDDSSGRGALTQAEEEEVEHISQKLKIATRKGHGDKVKKYETRLRELGVAGGDEEAQQTPSSGNEESAVAQVSATEGAPSNLKRNKSAVTFALDAGTSTKMMLQLRIRKTLTALGENHTEQTAGSEAEELTMKLRIHEAKNADETKTVLIRAQMDLGMIEAAGEGRQGEEQQLPPHAHVLSWHD